jgi:glucan phosphorylase
MLLYLLDTDIDDNIWEDRSITHQLYGGDNENRLRQEILLGIGGLSALKAIGISPDLYHLNEGHASFLGLERLRNYIKDNGLSYEEALEVVRST